VAVSRRRRTEDPDEAELAGPAEHIGGKEQQSQGDDCTVKEQQDSGDNSTVSPTSSDISERTATSVSEPLPLLTGLWQETVAFFLTSGDIGRLSCSCQALRTELTTDGGAEGTRRLLMVPTLELCVETAEAELGRVSVPHVRVLRLVDRLPFNAVAAAARAWPEGFQRLNKLTMKGCHLYPADVGGLLAPSIAATPFLKLLNLEKNKVDDSAVQALCQSGLLAKVDTLNLRFNMIGDAGAIALAACKGARTLRWVNLKMNRVGDKGARALAGLLEDNHCMVLLNLRRQTPALTDSAALGFAGVLPRTSALEALRLRRNRVTDRGASALAAATKELMLRRCREHAPWGPVRFELDLEENRVGPLGGLALLRCASCVPAHVRLELLVYGNQVGQDGLRKAAEQSEEGLDATSTNRIWFASKPESSL
jgi:hypothetical protein